MKKFSTVKEGYNPKEVMDFVEDVISKIDLHIRQESAYLTKIKKLEQELYKCRLMLTETDQLKQNTKEVADKIIWTAKKEANEIINNAKIQSRNIIETSLIRAEQTEIETINLKKNLRVLKNKMKTFMEGQMELIDDIKTYGDE